MSINKFLLLTFVSLCLTSCAKDTFITYTGNMPTNDKIEQLSKGMEKEQVRQILGSPSSVVALDRDTWIYMSAEIEQIAFMKPQELERNLLVIKFDNNGKIDTIQHIDKSDGNNVQISQQETATPEQEQGFFRKYFGGVGQFTPFGSSNSENNL